MWLPSPFISGGVQKKTHCGPRRLNFCDWITIIFRPTPRAIRLQWPRNSSISWRFSWVLARDSLACWSVGATPLRVHISIATLITSSSTSPRGVCPPVPHPHCRHSSHMYIRLCLPWFVLGSNLRFVKLSWRPWLTRRTTTLADNTAYLVVNPSRMGPHPLVTRIVINTKGYTTIHCYQDS